MKWGTARNPHADSAYSTPGARRQPLGQDHLVEARAVARRFAVIEMRVGALPRAPSFSFIETLPVSPSQSKARAQHDDRKAGSHVRPASESEPEPQYGQPARVTRH